MFPCPRCGRPVPEVIGVEEQRCPHCAVAIGAPRVTTGKLLAGGFGELFSRAPTWWGAFLWPAVAVDAATVAAALASPALGSFLTRCGATPARVDPVFLVAAFLLLFLNFAAYIVGWASVAALHAGQVRDRSWWQRALAGSAILAAIALVGLVLILPALFLFVAFLFAPVALGRGVPPGGTLDAARRANRRRPTGLVLAVLALAIVAETALFVASCFGSFWTSLAVQGLLWWALAPVVPVLTTHAYARLQNA